MPQEIRLRDGLQAIRVWASASGSRVCRLLLAAIDVRAVLDATNVEHTIVVDYSERHPVITAARDTMSTFIGDPRYSTPPYFPC
ncbi:hypothetical protein [Mycobacterium simiae]|uniref:hypothetical protein n=1 Tax=Mycobacterium simiae TaxID=1784 RepID=UPI0012DF61EF|nr:hypothetical protein [Mycobacterium simiae]